MLDFLFPHGNAAMFVFLFFLILVSLIAGGMTEQSRMVREGHPLRVAASIILGVLIASYLAYRLLPLPFITGQ